MKKQNESQSNSGIRSEEITYKLKNPWTTEEDTYMRILVEQMGPSRWSHISYKLTNRTGKQCRGR